MYTKHTSLYRNFDQQPLMLQNRQFHTYYINMYGIEKGLRSRLKGTEALIQGCGKMQNLILVQGQVNG